MKNDSGMAYFLHDESMSSTGRRLEYPKPRHIKDWDTFPAQLKKMTKEADGGATRTTQLEQLDDTLFTYQGEEMQEYGLQVVFRRILHDNRCTEAFSNTVLEMLKPSTSFGTASARVRSQLSKCTSKSEKAAIELIQTAIDSMYDADESMSPIKSVSYTSGSNQSSEHSFVASTPEKFK